MADINNGFADLAGDLAAIALVVTDENVQAKALEAGAVPVVNQAIMLAPRGKTGDLARSIGVQYSTLSKAARIGIGEPVSKTNSSTGYYGRFQNNGWHITRRRRNKSSGGSSTKKARADRRTGRVRQGVHFLGRAMDAQESNAIGIVLKELEKALDK